MNKELKIRAKGKDYWRSLDELADTPEFREFLKTEFPHGAESPGMDLSRRKFLSLMGASLAFAGLAGCHRPVEKIVPYVKAPEDGLPGEKLFYATAIPLGLTAQGLVVESHVGRPTKIEGNEKHAMTRGRSNARVQASILDLYDPDRSHAPVIEGYDSDWIAFVSKYQEIAAAYAENGGEGLAVLLPSFASPSLYAEYELFRKNYPNALSAVWDAVSDENIHKGLALATGNKKVITYQLENADVILSLDSDVLNSESDDLNNAAGFGEGRKVESVNDSMNRLYAVESNYTVTGSNADHRMRVKRSEISHIALKLAHILNKKGYGLSLPPLPDDLHLTAAQEKWLSVAAEDLEAHTGRAVIVAGRTQPPEVHALVYGLNQLLDAAGNTVVYHDAKDTLFPDSASLKELAAALDAGKVKTLVLFDNNIAFWGPSDLNFPTLLRKADNVIHFGAYRDESYPYAGLHVPLAHYMESWGDVRASDGSRMLIQPMILPLFNGVSPLQFMHLLATLEDKNDFDILQEKWRSEYAADIFDIGWKKLLAEGVDVNDLYPAVKSDYNAAGVNQALTALLARKDTSNGLEVNFEADRSVFDGRYANNGWLQEVPDPITKVTWDNPALISPATAERYSLENGDVVNLELNGKHVELPVWIVPGHSDGSVTLTLGYGRRMEGRIAAGAGFDVYPLRRSDGAYMAYGGKLQKLNRKYELAGTQDHGSMEGRPLLREASLQDYQAEKGFSPAMVKHPPLESLWEEHKYDEGYQWGMVIDLNSCIGCNACTLACQSENNIPVVGKELVSQGREMHWIRLDRYFSGDLADPEIGFQPVNCQHCEMAPCEQVCPVAATSHDEEGLNVMTYNRCIGTRYCANNCPFKVRRFNFYNYTKDLPESLKMAQNPEVTVRSRGVMEKCTFCTQRLNRAKIKAKNEGRTLQDGEVQAACQQACPTHAISFGNILDKRAEVTRMKGNDRNYAMLAEYNLKTRNTYLAKLRNPHPKLTGEKTVAASDHH